MAVREILLIGNPVLREISDDIISFDDNLVEVVNDLRDTLLDFQQRKKIGRGIAAPQIGVLKKVLYLSLPDRSFELVNPKIISESDETFEVWDSCFSFDVAFFVKTRRYKSIKVQYQNIQGELFEEEFTGDLSELLQHEIDHLYGVLAIDRLISNQDIILRSEWEKMNL